MRIVGFADGHETQIAVLDGERLELLGTATEFYRDPLAAMGRARTTEASLRLCDVRQVAPVWPGARVLCVGLNYREHAAEGGFEPPAHPAVFGRWTRSLSADGDTIPILDERLDYEGELAAVVGRAMADVGPEEALAGVFGYAPFNDVSARTFQRHTHQWTPGKNMDRSGAMGAVTTADQVGDPARGLALATRLNGETMQSASTADMIFPVGDILSYLSRIMTLCPGDVVVTGTPSGVGYARMPPVFLKPGDIVEVTIERLGSVTSRIVPAAARGQAA